MKRNIIIQATACLTLFFCLITSLILNSEFVLCFEPGGGIVLQYSHDEIHCAHSMIKTGPITSGYIVSENNNNPSHSCTDISSITCLAVNLYDTSGISVDIESSFFFFNHEELYNQVFAAFDKTANPSAAAPPLLLSTYTIEMLI